MPINVGNLVGRGFTDVVHTVAPVTKVISNIDPTPGFNINAHAGGGLPFVSRGNGSTGIAPKVTTVSDNNTTQDDTGTTDDKTTDTSVYTGANGTNGNSSNAADVAAYQDQINSLNNLLSQADIAQGNGLQAYDKSYNN